MTTTALLVFAGAVLLAGPPLLASARIGLAPRPAIRLWQALAAGVLASAVLAGLTLLIPTTALGGGLAEMLHACAMTVAGV